MTAVLGHLNARMKAEAVSEIKRVLKPKGTIILLEGFESSGEEDVRVITRENAPHVHMPTWGWYVANFRPLKVEVIREIEKWSKPKVMLIK